MVVMLPSSFFNLTVNFSCDRLTQLDRCIGIAAPVYTGVDAVTKADIVPQLIQFAVNGHLSSITTRILV